MNIEVRSKTEALNVLRQFWREQVDRLHKVYEHAAIRTTLEDEFGYLHLKTEILDKQSRVVADSPLFLCKSCLKEKFLVPASEINTYVKISQINAISMAGILLTGDKSALLFSAMSKLDEDDEPNVFFLAEKEAIIKTFEAAKNSGMDDAGLFIVVTQHYSPMQIRTILENCGNELPTNLQKLFSMLSDFVKKPFETAAAK